MWISYKYHQFGHVLKRVDFNAIVDHLALTHIIKSKDPTSTRLQRLLEVLSSYSLNLYHIKGKDMILSDFLSRQKDDDSNPHEIIHISFNKQNVLLTRYFNIDEKEQGKYLVQTRPQVKSSGIILPEEHGSDKGIGLNTRPEKQVIKPIISPEAKGIHKAVAIHIAYVNMQMSTPSYVPVWCPGKWPSPCEGNILHLAKPANQHQWCLQVGLIVYKHHALLSSSLHQLTTHPYLHLHNFPGVNVNKENATRS